MFIVVEVLPQPQFAKVATADLFADPEVRSDHQNAGRRTDRVPCGVHAGAATSGGATAASTTGRCRCSGTGNSTFSIHVGGRCSRFVAATLLTMVHFLIFPLFFQHSQHFFHNKSPNTAIFHKRHFTWIWFSPFSSIYDFFRFELTPHLALKLHHNYREGKVGISYSSHRAESSARGLFSSKTITITTTTTTTLTTPTNVSGCVRTYTGRTYVVFVYVPVRVSASGQM